MMTRFLRKVSYIFPISFANYVNAARSPAELEDAAAEFSNAIISDLGPLISLFGEQVTKQFLSQSMCWWDHIVFAVAPLGIITAIVSAIRVGGPAWLRAIVGRAKEPRGVTEVELLASTSLDVCELWDGHQMVRVMGTSPVVQLLYFPEYCDTSEVPGQETCGLFTLKEAVRKGLLVPKEPSGGLRQAFRLYIHKLHWIEKIKFKSRKGASTPDSDLESQSREELTSNPNTKSPQGIRTNYGYIDLHRAVECAPNIVLNYELPERGNRRLLPLYAFGGLLLQLAVLVADGVITYYPTLKLVDAKSPISSSAFHLTIIGTLMVVAGMALCSFVIELSTVEVIWESKNNSGFYLLWVQKGQTVNDQQFQSYALFAKNQRTSIMTSFPVWFAGTEGERRINFASSSSPAVNMQPIKKHTPTRRNTETQKEAAETFSQKSSSSEEYPQDLSGKAEPNNENVVKFIKWLVGVATLVSVCGFILQFTGLRGMHWSATVIQLGATILMTVVRSLIRLDVTNKPQSQPLQKDSELEILALQLASIADNSQCYRSSCSQKSPTPSPDRDTHTTEKIQSKLSPVRLWNRKHSNSTADHSRGGRIKKHAQSDPYRLNLCINWNLQILGKQPDLSHTIKLEPLTSIPSPEHSDVDTTADKTAVTPHTCKITNLVAVRTRLAKLTKFVSPAKKDATSLQNAIEHVMNQVYSQGFAGATDPNSTPSQHNQVTWPIQVIANKQEHEIHVTLSWDSREHKWQADEHELEAILALSGFRVEEGVIGKNKKKRVFVLGSHKISPFLSTACGWWITENMDSLMFMETDSTGDDGVIGMEGTNPDDVIKDDLVGYINPDDIAQVKRIRFRALSEGDWLPPTPSGGLGNESQKKKIGPVLVSTSYGTGYGTHALHLFSILMLAVANSSVKLQIQIHDETIVDMVSSTSKARQSEFVTEYKKNENFQLKLQHSIVTNIIRGVEQSLLCTKAEAQFVIIPALSVAATLRTFPPRDPIIRWARDRATSLEKAKKYTEAGEVYIRLLQTYRSLGWNHANSVKVMALFLEFEQNVLNAVALWKHLHGEGGEVYLQLKKLQGTLRLEFGAAREEMKDSSDPENGDCIKQLKYMFCMMNSRGAWAHRGTDEESDNQTRASSEIDEIEAVRQVKGCPGRLEPKRQVLEELVKRPMLGFSRLHFNVVVGLKWDRVWARESAEKQLPLEGAPNTNSRSEFQNDIFDRSPLHYIGTATDEFSWLWKLVQSMPGATDMLRTSDFSGRTPLHYAVCLQNLTAVRVLTKMEHDHLTAVRALTKMEHDHLTAVRALTGMEHDSRLNTTVWQKDTSDMTALHYAGARGLDNEESANITQLLLELDARGQCLTIIDKYKRTPLHWAVNSGAVAVAIQLLDRRGSQHELTDNFGRTSLHLTAFITNIPATRLSELVEAFRTKDKDFKQSLARGDAEGKTVLHLAAITGNVDLVKALLPLNPPTATDKDTTTAAVESKSTSEFKTIDILDNDQRTPLLWAARRGHEKVVEFLLKRGASVDTKDKTGLTPLSWAVRNKHLGVVEALKKATIKEATEFLDSDKRGLVSWAAETGPSELLRVLVQDKEGPRLPVNTTDDQKRTPLIWASQKNQVAVVKFLISCGSDKIEPNQQDTSGYTALMWAAFHGYSAIVEILLNLSEVDVNCSEYKFNQTALSLAMENFSLDVVKLLLRHPKIDVNASDPYWGHTPLGWAIMYQAKTDITKLLVENPKTELNLEDPRWNETPLQLALAKDHNEEELNPLYLLISSSRINKQDVLRHLHFIVGNEEEHHVVGFILGLQEKNQDLFDAYRGSLLKSAILWGRVNIIKKCLAAEVNTLWVDQYQWTPLLCAYLTPDPEVRGLFAEALQERKNIPPMPKSPPITWSRTEKNNWVHLNDGGLIATYNGAVRGHLVQASAPFSGTIYFEIKMLKKSHDDVMGIGLCSGPTKFKRFFPGWAGSNVISWGYHGDDGEIYTYSSPASIGVSPEKYSVDDVVGCGVNTKSQIFFTRNGKYLGAPIDNVGGQLFAVVSFGVQGAIEANFGPNFMYKWDNNDRVPNETPPKNANQPAIDTIGV